MDDLRIPISGEYLLAHLAAVGLAAVLDAAGATVSVRHDADSQTPDPIVSADAALDDVAALVVESAVACEGVVEADLEPGRTGNDRRSVIWARGSFQNRPEQAVDAMVKREHLLDAGPGPIVGGLLAGIGTPAVWGPDDVKPSHGATALDGVLGNHTSDFVRGALRPARASVAAADDIAARLLSGSGATLDKTGWAPPGANADFVHQWLAAIGLCQLPVAHRPLDRSGTPAVWVVRGRGGGSGAVVPLVTESTSLARFRALLATRALTAAVTEDPGSSVVELRALKVRELMVFPRRFKEGSGSSVSFYFERGRWVPL